MEDVFRLSVLIVEDLADAAQMLAELLALCGHAVRVAGTGADAVRLAEADPPDVILLDIGLPDASGWQVAARLRAVLPGKQPFVVAVTGFGTDGDRWRSADAGIDLHLVKPADPDELVRLLAWVRDNLPSPSANRREGEEKT